MSQVTKATTSEVASLALSFPLGLPGFEAYRSYWLVALGPCYGPYLGLRAAREDGPTFVVAQPSELGIELSVDIDDFHQSLLGLTEARQALVLLIVTLRGQDAYPTVNTRAPLVINVESLRAAQIVQEDQAYRLDEPAPVQFFDPTREPS